MAGYDEHLKRERERQERRGSRRFLWQRPTEGIDLASNDYLDLTRDPRLRFAAEEALDTYGTSAAGSRVHAGNLAVHDELDMALASLLEADAALTCSSGYTANLAAVTALVPGDGLVVVDEHAHASLVDGARLARTEMRWLDHSSPTHLEELLARHGRPGALVLVESVYSAAGDVAPLTELHEVCQAFDAVLVVDEAHGIGTLGGGRGGVFAAGLAGDPSVVVTGSLGKACASQGGLVAGAADVIGHLVSAARPFVYDTGLAPAAAAAAGAAVRIIDNEPGIATRACWHAARVAAGLGVPEPAAAIVSMPVAASRSDAVVREARAAGVLIGRFHPGSTPDGSHRLRLTGHAGLTEAELTRACEVLAALELNNVQPGQGSVD